jgi:CDP-paratose 2-epimerase
MRKQVLAMTSGPVVIFGGAGFVGTNLAAHLLSRGEEVRVFDDLSRLGVERNLQWLRERYEAKLDFRRDDIRDAAAVRDALRDAAQVYHFAAQVAVSQSLGDPVFDFDVNVRGTLNVLEALRDMPNPPPLYFTSTSKVYGNMRELALRESAKRYEVDRAEHRDGFSEATPLDFQTPYGCSKGTADQYVLDYARSFGLLAVVFRMSCVYGPRQFGTEDQGWLSHFLTSSLAAEPITIYGNGKQVRDVLFVDDLMEAFDAAREQVARLSGRAFNLGGGPAHTLSLLEVVDHIAELRGQVPRVVFAPERAGDRRYYVSDTRRFRGETGWTPATGVRRGLRELYLWLSMPAERKRASRPWVESLR